MQIILVNKENDYIVEHIIPLREGETFKPNLYPEYYHIIEDSDNLIQEYNLRYNIETEDFEVVDGIEARPNTEVLPSTMEVIKENLNEKDEEILNLKSALADTSEEKDDEILKLKLALAEVVEGGI
ncbi:hypothetical protein ACQPU1_01260 [Clostridium paraputrificum]|uniref:hypothetical protein n=1 Tax=Clostridium paraputrificum TaxID=29363 RepID=UPI003D33B7BB